MQTQIQKRGKLKTAYWSLVGVLSAVLLSVQPVMESVSIFPSEYYDVYLFSKSGFADDILAVHNPSVHLVTIEEMVK